MRYKLISTTLILVAAFAFSACQKSVAENTNILLSQTATPSQILSPTIETTSDTLDGKLFSSIRKVDFRNFTYSYPSDASDTFTLINGEKEQMREKEEDGAALRKIEYGDITNDGEEEAMISIYPLMDGNCQCEMVHIYTLENKKPKLLWSFDTWDKAQGGLKKVYAENGELVVETFGDNKFENDKWDFKFPKEIVGYCCPTAFTKIRFRWNGEKFVVEGKPELSDYDWRKKQNKN